MDLGISGRRAAVAASSQGLGFATAAALAENGVTVAICSRDRARIDAAAAQIGANAVPLVADVSTEEGGAAFVRAAQRRARRHRHPRHQRRRAAAGQLRDAPIGASTARRSSSTA